MRKNTGGGMSDADAEAIAAAILGFLAENPDHLGRFLVETGIGPGHLRVIARDRAFLVGLLDFLLSGLLKLLILRDLGLDCGCRSGGAGIGSGLRRTDPVRQWSKLGIKRLSAGPSLISDRLIGRHALLFGNAKSIRILADRFDIGDAQARYDGCSRGCRSRRTPGSCSLGECRLRGDGEDGWHEGFRGVALASPNKG